MSADEETPLEAEDSTEDEPPRESLEDLAARLEEERLKALDDLAMHVETISYTAAMLGNRNDIQGWDEFTIGELAPLLKEIAVANKRLKDAENGIAERVAALMDKKVMTISGVVLEKGDPTGSVTWNWASLIPDLVARASDERNIDRETGEALESEVNAVIRVLTDCVAFQYARVGKIEDGTGLKARGLDPEDYRTKPTGPRRAKVKA